MTDDNMESPRRRQASAEAIAGREAATLVRQLNRQLGMWQATSVKLHTMANRLKSAGRTDPAVVEEARTLFQVVTVEAQRFERMLPRQPSTVANHGRVNDTRRSFEMITERLRESLKLLGSEPPVGGHI